VPWGPRRELVYANKSVFSDSGGWDHIYCSAQTSSDSQLSEQLANEKSIDDENFLYNFRSALNDDFSLIAANV
jgi:hypothetical protein